MFYYKVIHKHIFIDKFESINIGIYSSLNNAKKAVANLKDKEGFKETKNNFKIKKVFRFSKPEYLDETFFTNGIDYIIEIKDIGKKVPCDETKKIIKYFSFLIKEYNFKFKRISLDNFKSPEGKLWYYGPYNCYAFYNDVICINFLHLVQRDDWNVKITKKFSTDQKYIYIMVKVLMKNMVISGNY